MHGKYSSYGNYYLDPSSPVYDGTQNEWVQEEVSLMDFANKSITLRFKFYSDSFVKEDGFYFDDLTVSVISTITGILPNNENNLFVSDAYPNPAEDAFSIQYKLKDNDNAVFELYDLSGNRLQTIQLNDNKGILNIQLSDLPAGVYYFRLKDGKQVSKSSKLIKL